MIDFFQKHKLITILFLVAMFTAAVLLFYIQDFKNLSKTIIIRPEPKKENNLIDSKRAVILAFDEAKKWQKDAKVADIKSGKDANAIGEASEWTIRFSSENKKNKGFEVKIKNKKIISSNEIDFYWKGGNFGGTEIISQKEAIANLRSQKGFENLIIESVNLYYEPNDKNWYYGIKTEKGIISIKANK